MRGIHILFLAVIGIALLTCAISAQTTAFTYQGSMKDGATAANGNYDFEFKLFDMLSGGAQLGSTIQQLNVTVANGIFAVSLDFGAANLPGADRFLEIGVRVNGNPGGFQQLLPRQKVNSAPYSVRSLNSTTADTATNATQLGGVVASQYVVTTDPRMTDARPPTAGSADYVQNTTSPQASSNFNISGNGRANILSATTQFNIGLARILSNAGTFNLFAGSGAGISNTGERNSFFGGNAGLANTTGERNSFFGAQAGQSNTTGLSNSIFGSGAGYLNTTGGNNSFFGASAGLSNTSASSNSFFGAFTGNSNTTGFNNSFFGANAGLANLTGVNNSFFGASAGQSNTGDENSFFGKSAGQANTTGFQNTYFGARAGQAATIGNYNSIFGAQAGPATTTGEQNSFFGRDAGLQNTTGNSNSFFGIYAGQSNTTGLSNTMIGATANVGASNLVNATAIGANALVVLSNSLVLGSIVGVNGATANTNVGIGTTAPLANLDVRNGGTNAGRIQVGGTVLGGDEKLITFGDAGCGGVSPYCVYIGERFEDDTMELRASLFNFLTGNVQINTLGTAGATSLCRNGSNQVSTCSSSLRYKTNITRFSDGLSFVNKLRPISFDWKDGGLKDVGFGAEDVEKIDPRFVTYNSSGQVEGIKYDRLSAAFVNAFKEQQTQIDTLQKENSDLRLQFDEMRKILCSLKADAEMCRTQEK